MLGGAQRVMIWSGFATAALLAAGFVYFAIFAFNGGLQSVLETDAPPEWALTELVVLSVIIVMFLLAAGVLPGSPAGGQPRIVPWLGVGGRRGASLAGG